jgi:adenine deaminase
MVEDGFTPYEALRTATGNAATALGRGDELGALAVGQRADLALVEGDPLADIAAAAAVQQVAVGGHLFSREALLAPFRPAATAVAPVAAIRVLPAAFADDDQRHWWHGRMLADQCSC